MRGITRSTDFHSVLCEASSEGSSGAWMTEETIVVDRGSCFFNLTP